MKIGNDGSIPVGDEQEQHSETSWLPKVDKRYVLKCVAIPRVDMIEPGKPFILDSTNYGKAVKEALRFLGYTIEYEEVV